MDRRNIPDLLILLQTANVLDSTGYYAAAGNAYLHAMRHARGPTRAKLFALAHNSFALGEDQKEAPR